MFIHDHNNSSMVFSYLGAFTKQQIMWTYQIIQGFKESKDYSVCHEIWMFVLGLEHNYIDQN